MNKKILNNIKVIFECLERIIFISDDLFVCKIDKVDKWIDGG